MKLSLSLQLGYKYVEVDKMTHISEEAAMKEHYPKIDLLIAKHVMGWQQHQDYEHLFADKTTGNIAAPFIACPAFSKDISSAWIVLEKLFTHGFDSEIELFMGDNLRQQIRITIREINKQENAFIAFGNKESACMAICEAALKTFKINL